MPRILQIDALGFLVFKVAVTRASVRDPIDVSRALRISNRTPTKLLRASLSTPQAVYRRRFFHPSSLQLYFPFLRVQTRRIGE